jgi:hypothetical protein
LNNDLRPDFTPGHLARNWNQAIINGFCDLNNPDCDILIHTQDDLTFKSGWLDNIVDYHYNRGYNFIVFGDGDNFCSYTPEAIKIMGMWDERYYGIGTHERDYFYTAIRSNYDNMSMNDPSSGHRMPKIHPLPWIINNFKKDIKRQEEVKKKSWQFYY